MTTEIQRDEMQRRATSAVAGVGDGTPSRDPTPDLRPPTLRGTGGGPGQFDRMRRGHPGVAAGCRELALAIGAAVVEFVGPDDETPSETAFREDLQAMLIEGPYVDADNGDGGWSSLGATLAEYYLAGHYLAEIRYVPAPRAARRRMASLDGLALELYPIHASSIQSWNTSGLDASRLESVTQATPSRYVDVMADRLIYLRHGGAVGEFEGVSILRPLVFAVERWISIATSAERSSYFGGGVAKIRTPKAEDPTARDLMIQSVTRWQSGAAAFIVCPPGFDVDLSYPSAGANDPRSVLEYYDGLIAQTMGRALSALGYSARGSLALGEAVAAADGWQTTAQLDLLLSQFGERVGQWVARSIGYVGRLPRLRAVGESSPDVSARVATVAQAHAAGLLGPWTATDAARMRDELDLDNGATSIAASESHACSTSCGCGTSLRLAEGGRVTVIGADGLPYETHRPLEGAELSVAWSSNERTIERLNAEMEREIEALAERHRAAVWAAVADGEWSAREQSTIYDRFRGEYREIVARYAERVGVTVTRWAADEQDRQIRRGLPETIGGAQGRSLPDSDRVLSRIGPRIDVSADEIANRVQGEVETAWAAGQTRTGWQSRITPRGLARSARAVGAAIESEGRVAAAQNLASGDLVVTEVIRTSIPDGRRCEVCADRDGVSGKPGEAWRFKLPEQRAEYDRSPLPDPDCAGGSDYCRCGWLVVWGRRS